MHLGIIGLGRIDAYIARRRRAADHRCVVHDRNVTAVDTLTARVASAAGNLNGLVRRLAPAKLVGFGGHVESGPQA